MFLISIQVYVFAFLSLVLRHWQAYSDKLYICNPFIILLCSFAYIYKSVINMFITFVMTLWYKQTAKLVNLHKYV